MKYKSYKISNSEFFERIIDFSKDIRSLSEATKINIPQKDVDNNFKDLMSCLFELDVSKNKFEKKFFTFLRSKEISDQLIDGEKDKEKKEYLKSMLSYIKKSKDFLYKYRLTREAEFAIGHFNEFSPVNDFDSEIFRLEAWFKLQRILAKKIFELSEDFGNENREKISRLGLLTEHYHNSNNINKVVAELKKVLYGFSNFHKSLVPNNLSIGYSSYRYSEPLSSSRSLVENGNIQRSFFDIDFNDEYFSEFIFTHLKNSNVDLKKYANNRYINPDRSSNLIYKSLEGEINKVFHEIAKMTYKDQGKFLTWIEAEKNHYQEQFYSNRIINKTKIHFYENLGDKGISNICDTIINDYEENKTLIKKLHKNASSIFNGKYKKNIPRNKYKYLCRLYQERDSDIDLRSSVYNIDDLKEAKKNKDYEVMRIWLHEEHEFKQYLKSQFKTDDFIGLKSINLDGLKPDPKKQSSWNPNEFFSLKRTFPSAFNKKYADSISRLLALMRINPIIYKYFARFLADLLNVNEITGKNGYELPVIDTHLFVNSHLNMLALNSLETMMDSLTKALLFCEGVNPYENSKDAFEYIPYELDTIIAFLESILREYRKPSKYKDFNLGLENLDEGLWFVPPDKLIFLWNTINNFKSLKEYISLMVRLNIVNKVEKDKKSAYLTLEQIHFLSRRASKEACIDKKNIKKYLISKKNKYQKYSYLRKEMTKENSLLRWSSKKKVGLHKQDAIKWLKSRPGKRKLRDIYLTDGIEGDIDYSLAMELIPNMTF